jgi:beta-lactamase superfamily II metal-dependent hydrolase
MLTAAPAYAAGLKIVSVDVEGGAATLFLTPEGKSLLIDTGWPAGFGEMPSPDGTHEAADRVIAATKKLGITRLDYVIVTHYHDDHAGGVTSLSSRFPIGTFIDHGPVNDKLRPNTPPEKMINTAAGQYALYLEAIKGHPRIIAKPGDVIHIGSLTDTIVSSNTQVLDHPLPGAGTPNPNCDVAGKGLTRDENASSVASLLTFGKVRIAQFGDLSWDKEYELACPVDRIGKVNLLLVTQHGSGGVSSNPAQISAMRPDVAIMPNGGKKGGDPEPIATVLAQKSLQGFWRLHESYKHPELSGDKDMIANLNPPQDAIDAVAAKPYEAPPDMGYNLDAEVTADGRITVTNERNGFSKTYQVK